jgi:hypothetical protein
MTAMRGLRDVRRDAALFLMVPSLFLSVEAVSATYKCKDASGRILYSESPCPGAVTQQKMNIESDRREDFLAGLLSIAQHGDLADIEFTRKALGVRFEESLERGMKRYRMVNPPQGYPAASMQVGVPPEPRLVPVMNMGMDQRQCITRSMVSQTFGTGNEAGAEAAYEIKSSGAFSTAVFAYFLYSREGAYCVDSFMLKPAYRQR